MPEINIRAKYAPLIPLAVIVLSAIRATVKTMDQRNQEYESFKLAVKFLVWSQFLQWLIFTIFIIMQIAK